MITKIEPKRSRLKTQKEYRIPEGEDGMLTWTRVIQQIKRAKNYWLVTVRPDKRPHAMPVWGVWVDNELCFGTGRDTRKARNLVKNPNAILHLDSSDDVIIIEGVVREIREAPVQAKIDDAYEMKYQMRHGTPMYALTPTVIFAWDRGFPKTATRWTF